MWVLLFFGKIYLGSVRVVVKFYEFFKCIFLKERKWGKEKFFKIVFIEINMYFKLGEEF